MRCIPFASNVLVYIPSSVNVGEDCPVFDGLFEFCQLSTGGSVGKCFYPDELSVSYLVISTKFLSTSALWILADDKPSAD